MRLFSFVWKNLTRRRLRSALTIIGLAVAVSAVVALFGLSDSFSRHFRAMYARRGIDLVVQRAGGEDLNNGMPDAWGDEIKKLPGVSIALGGLMDIGSFPDKDIMNVIINGWPADSPLWDELTILPGGRKPGSGDRRQVLVGKVLANNLGVKVGDKIPLYGEEVTVLGIVDSAEAYEAGAITTLQSDLQEFMNRPRQATGFIVRSSVPKDAPDFQAKLADLKRRIEELHPGLVAIPTNEFIDNVTPIKLSRAVAWATSAIALLIGAIGMLNTMAMSVFERIKEIGTLRAIGWRKRRVMRMILGESFLLSLAGGLLGSVAAVLFLRGLSHVPEVANFVQGDIDPWIIGEGFLLAIGVGVAGAIYPAYWGANLSPIEALRKK